MSERDFFLVAFAGMIGLILWAISRKGSIPFASGDTGGNYFPPDYSTNSYTDQSAMPISPAVNLSAEGADFIKQSEGFTPIKLVDGAKFQIGYGHNIKPGESFPGPISQSEADALFDTDIAPIVSDINRWVSVPLNQGQFDALVSFAYNVGTGAFNNSTLLRLLNSGDYTGASAQFPLWINAGGRSVAGLITRRASERAMFDGGGYFS